ncbi:hypothetical protein L249_1362 [Ophiocordyceps polyrhachis-furcata BCC 54312]|uniref:Polyketide synthase n=1 Tax=Ophiocordyceps polyrhachis-furcata BCC 54312 TaxID=1330021 RepID=A0A367KZ03_9HYPO|nr:hypothetical protein L249_1362 [Ophiocordyceps polyrhachis-furcata BCC 54312]
MDATSDSYATDNMAELLVFGDLTANFGDDLRCLLHIKESEALQPFFERVAFSLREEIGSQPTAVQDLFPRFTTLIDILAKADETEGSPMLRFCLMTVCQLAKFIHFAEGRPFPTAQDTYLLGVCTGTFAASAISVSRTISDVVAAGVEATRAAFRTALRSFLQRGIITTAGNKPWSAVVSRENPLAQLIDNFPVGNALSKPYISALSPTNATISGPPDSLQAFISDNGLQAHRLAIQSPFHAPHIFCEADVDYVLEGFPEAEFREKAPVIPLLSGSTGDLVDSDDGFRGLLREAASSVLLNLVQWEDILASLSTVLHERKLAKLVLSPFYCNATSLMSSYLAHDAGLEVAVQNIVTAPPKSKPTGRFDQSKIAIIGYSGRFPDAADTDELWELLHAGRDVHRDIPASRFDWETYHDATGKKRNTNKVRHGCFIKEPGLFDTRFFNMSPREADSTDPAHRLAITATYEAMEMAGMVPNRTPSTQQDRVGVFMGICSDDWREVNASQNVDTYHIPGGVRAFLPGRISYFFRFSGPSLSIDTACSSSFAAIQSAVGYLLRGECDTAVAGGTNILTNPDIFTGLDRGHFLAQTGNCNTFDDSASGYCRAEAVGAVILKRYEDAVADEDPIFGVIVGANTNHCGQTDSITRPHEGDQVSVFNRVLRYQNINPNDIGYVEMHGTGTQAGDATEMRSVMSVFLPDKRRTAEQPLYLGSAKANVGHSESASGVVSMIKVLLMMKHDMIPPHCGIKGVINRNYPKDLAERNIRIAFKPTAWPRLPDGVTRKVFLNNFSAAGGNTAILIEDAPPVPEAPSASDAYDQRGSYIVTVTAKTAKALESNIRGMSAFLDAHPDTSLAALSYTTTARRMHHNFRVACSGDSLAVIKKELDLRASAGGFKSIPGPAKLPDVAFVFTGQGTFYTSLGRDLFETLPEFRDDMIQFNRLAVQQGFPEFLPLVDGSAADNLEDVDICASHLALVCLQMALTRVWNSWNIHPAMVIGHSLGEYAALYAAGVISASDAIFLAGTRASLLSKYCTAGTHAMLAVKSGVDVVRPLLEGSSCDVTCINQPAGTVVGGKKEDIEKLTAKLREHSLEAILLDIPFSFHTAQVDPILEDFEKAAGCVEYRTPEVPVMSPLLGRVERERPVFFDKYLAKACRGVVNFQGALEDAKASGLVSDSTIWLEIGAHPACSGMVKSTLGASSTALACVRKGVSLWKTMVSCLETLYLKGLAIDWNNFHRGFGGSHQVVQLPRYCWDLKNHWIQYKNDWLLTKGEGVAPVSHPRAVVAAEEPVYRYVSPSVQRVLEEKHGANQSTILAESDICDPRLMPVLQGHIVNGAALCPSTLYGDIALTVTQALIDGNGSAKFTGFDVADVNIDRPLVALPSKTSQLFRVSATADWAAQVVAVSIYSVENGIKTANHAAINVYLTTDKATFLDEWKRVAYLIKGRIAALEQGVISGNSHKLKRSMAYKLFGSIVNYSPGYQGMREVILDSDALEATAKVVLQVGDQGFTMNPHWIDSMGHLAGFIMNGNENLPADQVFINHGWSHLRFGETPEVGKVYTTYNKMQLVEGKLYAGDTYILDGDRIVAVFDQVAFQGVPRRLLDMTLGKAAGKEASTAAAPKAAAAAAAAPKAAPKSAPKAAAAAPKAASSKSKDFGRVLAIIAEEIGVGLSELQPESEFADFGLDSLLSLTVTARINEEVGIDIPWTLFAAYPTVKDMKSLLDPEDGGQAETTKPSSETSVSSDDSQTVASDGENYRAIIRQTIADETGTAAEEIAPTTCLADLGVDSLLGLTIADTLSGALGTEISSTTIMELATIEEIEAALGKMLGLNMTDLTPATDLTPTAVTVASTPVMVKPTVEDIVVEDDVVSSPPHATSIALHSSKTNNGSERRLFLLPDGSGSAASYATFAKLDPSLTVIGINCPWRTTPEDMAKATFPQLISKYVAEIQRRQPHGPYMVGGWSAGGIFAFEVARDLMAAGEAVDRLVLIDSPNPIGLENPPERMYEFFSESGVLGGMTGGKAVPEWLRRHFAATVDMLDTYEPKPLANAPETLHVYARDGICKDPKAPKMETKPDDPREMLWLLNNRTDFSADGWASLLGRKKITVQVVDDVNHFTMMNEGAHMDAMRGYVRKLLKL